MRLDVHVDGDTIALDSVAFTLPVDAALLFGILGVPSRTLRLEAVAVLWDEHGVVATHAKKDSQVLTLSLAPGRFKPAGPWPINDFVGEITVDGAAVRPDMTLAELNAAKSGEPFTVFHGMDHWGVVLIARRVALGRPPGSPPTRTGRPSSACSRFGQDRPGCAVLTG